jgi:hypothetical protein
MRFALLLISAWLAFTASLPALPGQEMNDSGPIERVPEQDQSGLVVQDLFDRTVNTHGLVLVDWEGYIANPAIKFYLTPPPDATFPATAVLTAREPRLHFDLPSTTGADGPRKEIVWQERSRKPVFISIFPDRDGGDEEHPLAIDFRDAAGKNARLNVPIRVVDHDRQRDDDFHVAVDFGQDRTGFFADEDKRTTILQAARDWAYFLADMKLQPVPAGSETTDIWGPDGFKTISRVVNAAEYTGYLLYAYGIRNDLENADSAVSDFWKSMRRDPRARNVRSGGEPSREGGFQIAAGTTKRIRRSGGVEIEVQGNYNTLGWLLTLPDRDWWQATNYGDEKADLYSIAHHEIGHALVFNPNNTLVKRGASLGDEQVRAYLGSLPAVSRSDHLEGTVDPESLHGGFGNEYHGRMPRGRWLITKLDLLCAQAIGYELRPTSAFAPLSLAAADLTRGKTGKPYSARLRASGGIPGYHWEAIEPLPAGLLLNSFTGEIEGTPTHAGSAEFTVRVRDYSTNSRGVTERHRIEIFDDR